MNREVGSNGCVLICLVQTRYIVVLCTILFSFLCIKKKIITFKAKKIIAFYLYNRLLFSVGEW